MRTSGSFKKGEGGGRPKGVPNKITKDIREAYKMLIEQNLDNMTVWLAKIAAKDPAKAIYIISELSEYVIPKLARTELTGKDGADLIGIDTLKTMATDELVKRAEALKNIEKTTKK